MDIIDDTYWLAYGKKVVDNSITSINDAAAKLQNMTVWFCGLYTASFTIGVTINLIDAPKLVLGMLASPILTLIITYWFCILAQLPIVAEFDPTIPYEIKRGHDLGVLLKRRRLNWALICTLLSAMLLSFALFFLSIAHKKISPSLSASLNTKRDIIVISGIFPKNARIKTMIDSSNSSKNRITFYTNSFIIQENGVLNLNIPIHVVPRELIITCIDEGTQRGFCQTLR